MRRPAQRKSTLIQRQLATFDGLQALSYDLNRVAFGFANESSPQLSANTARLWSLGKADRVANTDKHRANTFGFLARNGVDYYQPLANSSTESFVGLMPTTRGLHSNYDAVVMLCDNLPAHKTAAVEAAARRHQIYLICNLHPTPLILTRLSAFGKTPSDTLMSGGLASHLPNYATQYSTGSEN